MSASRFPEKCRFAARTKVIARTEAKPSRSSDFDRKPAGWPQARSIAALQTRLPVAASAANRIYRSALLAAAFAAETREKASLLPPGPERTRCSRRSVRPKRPLVWMNGQAPRITIAEVIIRRRGQAARPPCHSSKQPRAEVRPRQLAASFFTAFRRFARRPLHSRYRLRLAAPSETKSPGQCRGLALRTGSLNVSSGRPQVRSNRTCSWL